MDKKIIYIYSLENKNGIFYIGKTKNISRRRSMHRKNYGYDTELFIIDEVEDNEWKFWECYWIEQFKQWGFKLTNLNNGGGGPTQWTEEQKFLINPNRIAKIKNHKTRGLSISQTLLNNDHSKYYNDIIRLKISKSKNDKNIIQMDLDGNYIKEWESIGLVSSYLKETFNLTSKNINTQVRDTCLNKQKTCHGYKFKYK